MRLARYVPLGAAVLVTQVALMPQLRLFGVVPDLGLLFALAIAWYEGSETGALFGFVVGGAYDLFLPTPLGLTGLAYALCAWTLGTTQGMVMRRGRLLTVAIGFVGGLAGGAIFVATSILAGADQLQHVGVLGVVLRVALYDAVLALPAFTLVTVLARRRSPAYG